MDLSDAQGVVNALAIQRNKWEERLSDISSRISSVPGHAMLCAAGVLYLSRSPPDRHKEMLNNWLGYCSGVVPLGSLKVEQNKLQSAQVHVIVPCKPCRGDPGGVKGVVLLQNGFIRWKMDVCGLDKIPPPFFIKPWICSCKLQLYHV